MKTLMERLTFETKQRRELVRLTDTVAALVRKSGVQEGMVLVSVRLWGAVLVAGLVSGCAAAIACRPGESTVDCCIKKYPLTAMESCTASRSDVLRILRDISLRIDDEEFENNEDLPEWKQICIKKFVLCADEGWDGSCYECLRYCEGQHEWPRDRCPDPREK